MELSSSATGRERQKCLPSKEDWAGRDKEKGFREEGIFENLKNVHNVALQQRAGKGIPN